MARCLASALAGYYLRVTSTWHEARPHCPANSAPRRKLGLDGLPVLYLAIRADAGSPSCFWGYSQPGPKGVGWGGNLRALAYRTGANRRAAQVSYSGSKYHGRGIAETTTLARRGCRMRLPSPAKPPSQNYPP